MAGMLRVVTFSRWLAHELAGGAGVNGVEVVGDDGLDLSPGADTAFWWCPGAHATRLAASGLQPFFMTPGVAFWRGLDPALAGRAVWCGPLADMGDWAGHRFAKVADTKIAALPAAVHPDADTFRAAAARAGLGAGSFVVVSEPVDMVSEWRYWILHGRPVASSIYLHHGTAWDGLPDIPAPARVDRFAAEVAATVAGMPAGWTLDVALTGAGQVVVVEANPAWSSGMFGASARQPGPLVATILASQGPGAPGTLWRDDRPGLAARPLPWRTGR